MKVVSIANGNDFVSEVAESLRKRSRAIRHRGALIECQNVKEIEDGVESEIRRLDIDISYRISAASVRVRLIVWSDRWLWIDARRSAKRGWAWEATMEGRFFSADGARALIRLLEDTISSTKTSDGVPATLERIWKPHLALGPRGL